jgi:hypothetical protein
VLRMIGMAIALAYATSAISGGPALPVQVQADVIFQEISDAIKTNRAVEALDGITRYRALNVAIPPKLLFFEARLAMLTDDPERAARALREYFSAVTKADANYADAIKLYPTVDRLAQERAATNAAAAKAAAEQRAAAEQAAKADAERKAQVAANEEVLKMTPEERAAHFAKINHNASCESTKNSLNYLKIVIESNLELKRQWLYDNASGRKMIKDQDIKYQTELKEKQKEYSALKCQ